MPAPSARVGTTTVTGVSAGTVRTHAVGALDRTVHDRRRRCPAGRTAPARRAGRCSTALSSDEVARDTELEMLRQWYGSDGQVQDAAAARGDHLGGTQDQVVVLRAVEAVAEPPTSSTTSRRSTDRWQVYIDERNRSGDQSGFRKCADSRPSASTWASSVYR